MTAARRPALPRPELTGTPVLETERLRLRAPRLSDFEPFVSYFGSERSRFTGGPQDRNLAWRAFCHLTGHWVHRGYGFFVLEEKDTGVALGTAGPFYPEGWPEPEIGWTLWHPEAEGKGYAQEAALAARAFVYDTLGWRTAISLIVDGNTRSEALARRMGCTLDGAFEHKQFGKAAVWRHPSPEALTNGGMEACA